MRLKCLLTHAKKTTWIFAIIEVSSRLWSSIKVGSRSYRNIRKLFGEAFHNGVYKDIPFITTDGFRSYGWVLKRTLGRACLYGQVIKKYKKNRVTKVERKNIIGGKNQIQNALDNSEDSNKLNTSFIERLNLTIRQNISYLHRKTSAHARNSGRLFGQLELQRCYYNFM